MNKPHISFHRGVWGCFTYARMMNSLWPVRAGYGRTPQEAYAEWQRDTIK